MPGGCYAQRPGTPSKGKLHISTHGLLRLTYHNGSCHRQETRMQKQGGDNTCQF